MREFLLLTLERDGMIKTMLIDQESVGYWKKDQEKKGEKFDVKDFFTLSSDKVVGEGVIQIMGDDDMMDDSYISD